MVDKKSWTDVSYEDGLGLPIEYRRVTYDDVTRFLFYAQFSNIEMEDMDATLERLADDPKLKEGSPALEQDYHDAFESIAHEVTGILDLERSRVYQAIREKNLGESQLSFYGTGAHWKFKQFLREGNFHAQFNVAILRETTTREDEIEVVEAKKSYYTAVHEDWSAVEKSPTVNHTSTHVIDKLRLGTMYDILVRTGNPINAIKPEVRAIYDRGEVGTFDCFSLARFPHTVEQRIDSTLKLTERYERATMNRPLPFP